jgi:hypothetical protein
VVIGQSVTLSPVALVLVSRRRLPRLLMIQVHPFPGFLLALLRFIRLRLVCLVCLSLRAEFVVLEGRLPALLWLMLVRSARMGCLVVLMLIRVF